MFATKWLLGDLGQETPFDVFGQSFQIGPR
jgi:hypothetical protein